MDPSAARRQAVAVATTSHTGAACDGCLGSAQCWICTGDGCGRCASSGRCHLCQPAALAQLIPRQPAHSPDDAVATAS